jgi:hypothetical protein
MGKYHLRLQYGKYLATLISSGPSERRTGETPAPPLTPPLP